MSDVARADLVITAGAVISMDRTRRIILDGAVAVIGQDIEAVGKRTEILAQYVSDRRLDRPNGVLTPGLIDAHVHTSGSYFVKGLCDELPQVQRLSERVIPHEAQLTEEESYTAALASFADMIRHGTTCFADSGGPRTAGTAQAALDIGIRGTVAPEAADQPGLFGGATSSTRDLLAETEEIMKRFHGAGSGRLRVSYNLAGPESVSDELVAGVVERAAHHDAGVLGHFVTPPPRPGQPEPPARNANLQRYEALGVLGARTLLTHIGWLNEADIVRLAESGTCIAHCPSSALLGASGWVAHGVVPELVAAGANVVLGTDGPAISRFLDLVRVMHLAATTHKDVLRDPTVMGAHEVFEMGTVKAAAALRWSDRIGSIEPGKSADLTVFDATGFSWLPNRFGNPVADLIYAASGADAEMVIIDGNIVMEGKKLTTIDVEHLAVEVDRVGNKALDRLGFRPAPQWPME